MKKRITKLLILLCCLTLIVSLSGCSVLMQGNNSTVNGFVGNDGAIEIELKNQSIFADTGNNSAQPTIENVKFKTIDNAQILSNVDAAEMVARSVVSIEVKYSTVTSYASGVIVDIEGGLSANEYYLLTAHHVVANGGMITVSIPDDNYRNATDEDYDKNYSFTGEIGGSKSRKQAVSLVGGDLESDIAVLKISVGTRKNAQNEPLSIVKSTVPASTDKIQYAEDVFAIGNPSGHLPMTFLKGNISYLSREILLDNIGYIDLVQHDCMITHGSSGGGLYNMKGQLIGITNSGSDEHKGMNYAVPFNGEEGFIEVATQLIKNSTATNYGYVSGRWSIGISISESDRTVKGSNVVIVAVVKNSNAYGLMQEGFYITGVKFSDEHNYIVRTSEDFKYAVFLAREYLTLGDKIEISIAHSNY